MSPEKRIVDAFCRRAREEGIAIGEVRVFLFIVLR
jgi:hypothetical protein